MRNLVPSLKLKIAKFLEDSDSDELVVSGLVEPYQGEPLAHLSNEKEHNEVDEDGLWHAFL